MPQTKFSLEDNICYASVRWDNKFLADEREKKGFLDLLPLLQQEYAFQVYAFAVLDEEVHLLLGSSGEILCEELMRTVIIRYRVLRQEKESAEGRVLEETYEYPQGALKVLQACQQIHMRPVTLGYVNQLKDYWWSSFQTYRGVYEWKFLNIYPILQMLDSDEKQGRRLFLQRHRRLKPEAAEERSDADL